jgi:hypothetical protein
VHAIRQYEFGPVGNLRYAEAAAAHTAIETRATVGKTVLVT